MIGADRRSPGPKCRSSSNDVVYEKDDGIIVDSEVNQLRSFNNGKHTEMSSNRQLFFDGISVGSTHWTSRY